MREAWDAFLAAHAVSRETCEKLDRYAALLTEWNAKINLVAASTLPELWTRHFLDSAQLLELDPAWQSPATRVIDIGSGAGFPALVMACLSPAQFLLLESIGKKAKFLQTVVDEIALSNVTIQSQRAETYQGPKVDLVTARAVTALPDLLSLAQPLLKSNGFCLFHKGQSHAEELTKAQRMWEFTVKILPSQTDPAGAILQLRGLRRKHV